MEIEVKYRTGSSDVADAIWENRLFSQYEEKGSREEQYFNAKYFDTDRCDLADREIAYRVRQEGDRIVATIKWKGHSEDGLHVREEINVPVDNCEPDVSVFRESSIGAEVMSFVEDRELRCVLQTSVYRRRFRIDTGTGLFELSLDSGKIVTENGSSPIDEVEIEIFSGETEELLKLGRKLQKEYGLEEENETKYSRGISLVKGR